MEQQTREISTVAFSFGGRRTAVALALKAMVAQFHLNGKTRKEFTIRQLAEIVELALMLIGENSPSPAAAIRIGAGG